MSPIVLWRKASRVSRVFAGLGFGAAVVVLGLAALPIYRSQTRPSAVVAAMLIGLSLWLLLEGYHRPVPPPQPGKPVTDANEAVLPVPEEPPRDAVGRESA